MAAQAAMHTKMKEAPGFIAALDQSGGSTPGALKLYGIAESEFHGDDSKMYALMHAMRVRVMSAPTFTGDKVIGAILFERTMDGDVKGTPVPTFLWNRGVVPFLKVDKGLEATKDGVQLMKPIPGLTELCQRAAKLGVYGTKMRSVIHQAGEGIAACIAQQFEFADVISRAGLVPIIEPEVSIKAVDKAAAEKLVLAEITKHLDRLPEDKPVMLKLTIPTEANLYEPLTKHPRVVRVVALSGGYSCQDACKELSRNANMIASFSRALLETLKVQMSDAEFNAAIGKAIDMIYDASVNKASGNL
ncbi:fructose-bisphosphate aldolase [Hyaloraphidium curvatum]|nr:fructose-bisphosphate aldolase [Hyaloraphidium curvatum]